MEAKFLYKITRHRLESDPDLFSRDLTQEKNFLN